MGREGWGIKTTLGLLGMYVMPGRTREVS